MTPESLKAMLNQVMDLLDEHYVFPAVATEIRRSLTAKLEAGGYAGITTAAELGRVVTEEMQAISRDKHMRLQPRDPGRPMGAPSPGGRADFEQRRQHQNHGFAKVERLAGNVGYLDLRGFDHPTAAAGQTAVAAMNFLGNSSALIFDMRKCPGGSAAMASLLISYLVEDYPVHLNSFYNRAGEEVYQNWTAAWVPGKRLPQVPVYVLTSDFTFSAAEEFTYDLRNLKRAVVVGEKTGGGANPGRVHPVGEELGLFVSDGRAYNPVSKDNWEGKGIEPDIAVPAAQAFDVAYAEALKQVAEDARSREGGAWAALAKEAEETLANLGR